MPMQENHYNFSEIEKKWRKHYEQKRPFRFIGDLENEKSPNKENASNKEKFYCLEMFPYPSGRLHMGHLRNYTVGDVIARLKRAKGFDVLHPIGWDAFGLPAENAAMEKKTHPAKWTASNIDVMRQQIKLLGFSYDFDREISTASEDYYRWGQWIFLKLHEKGLVYRKEAWVNWDPVDKTVLANEQVGEGGIAWRSKAVVVRKKIEQWYIKTTAYAKELYDDLDKLKGWGENVKNMQRNWIGKSTGAVLYFSYGKERFPVFTTRPDTIYGATFMAIAFDHENLDHYLNLSDAKKKELATFLEECKSINQKEDYEKKGFFTGSHIKNPITEEQVPLYVANFVLSDYGTGLVMGCPAHDQRDYEFAKKYGIEIRTVVKAVAAADKEVEKQAEGKKAYDGSGIMVNSPLIDGLEIKQAIKKIIEVVKKEGKGHGETNYRLKDWLISRQRYWGNPIPVLWESKAGGPNAHAPTATKEDSTQEDLDNLDKKGFRYHLVKEEDLPVRLPTDFDFNNVSNPLKNLKEFAEVKKDGKTFFRESDTMDTFTCSAWYFLRFLDAHNDKKPFSEKIAKRWMPVDQYIGGIEHACMHLLYARFFYKALRDMGLVKGDEPFANLLSQGMVLAKSYFSKQALRYFAPDELGKDKSRCPVTGGEIISRVEAMSKSKKNGVDPTDVVKKYGADATRLAILFAAPIERDMEWDEKTIEGCQRFLNKAFKMAEQLKEKAKELGLELPLKLDFESVDAHSHQRPLGIKFIRQTAIMTHKVEGDIERSQFNTPISAMMIFLNETQPLAEKIDDHADLELALCGFYSFLISLNLYCPFSSEEMNKQLFGDRPLYDARWKRYSAALLKDQFITIAVQVNGKLRSTIEIEQTEGTDQSKGISGDKFLAAKSEEMKAAEKKKSAVEVAQKKGMDDDGKKFIIEQCQKQENVAKFLEGKTIVKTIYVPEKLVNFVVK